MHFVSEKVCEYHGGRRGVLEEIEGYLLDNIEVIQPVIYAARLEWKFG